MTMMTMMTMMTIINKLLGKKSKEMKVVEILESDDENTLKFRKNTKTSVIHMAMIHILANELNAEITVSGKTIIVKCPNEFTAKNLRESIESFQDSTI